MLARMAKRKSWLGLSLSNSMEEITMTRTCSFGVLLLCLVVSFSAAYGQGNCTSKTIAGTYAFNFTGSSTIVTGNSPDSQDPLHWTALYGPIAGVGVFTVRPLFPRAEATADGYYWMTAGRMDLGDPANPIPFHANITVNADCTGLMTYTFGPYELAEHMVILDNGNEIRSLTVKTAVPTSNWVTISRRQNGACNQAKIAGSYLYSCKSLVAANPTTMIAAAALSRVNIESAGTASGVFTAKAADTVLSNIPFTSTLKVNDDCTVAEVQTVPGMGTTTIREVFFNEGREGFGLVLKSASEPYGYCDIKQIVNQASTIDTTPTPGEAPKADAGVDFTTVQPQVTLDGTKSTGTGLKYAWKIVGRTASINNANTATPFVQFGEGFGQYIFELTVTDSTGATSTARVTVLYLGR